MNMTEKEYKKYCEKKNIKYSGPIKNKRFDDLELEVKKQE